MKAYYLTNSLMSMTLFICCSINPNFTDALVKLSLILSSNKEDDKEAEHLLKRAVEIKPNDADILNNYAVFLNSLSMLLAVSGSG